MTTPEPSPPRRPRVGTVLAALMLIIGVASLGLTPVRTDHDVFWHLKTGQMIAEGGGLPRTDPFTWGSEAEVWHNHEWLAQIAMFAIHRLGAATMRAADVAHADAQAGMRLLVLAKTLMLLGVFGLVAHTAARAGACPILACLVALLAAMASRWTMHCRPPVITLLFLAALMLVLTRGWQRRRPRVAALGALLLFALWSNLHGGWLAGLVVLGCFAAGDATERNREGLRAHALIFVAALLGTLLNPSGWHLYALTWRVMSASELVARIPEMAPPPFPEHWPFYLLLVTAAAALIVAVRRRETVRPGEALAVLFFAWQATSHLRHAPLFAIVAAVPVARVLQAYVDWWAKRLPGRLLAATMLVKTLALTLFLLFGLGRGVVLIGHRLVWEPCAPRSARWIAGVGYEPDHYQDTACDVVVLADLPGRLWSNLNIGGFLIWRLSPEHHRVYTDSRFDLHGDARHRVEDSINGVGLDGGVPDPNWEQTLADFGVNVALLEKATPLVHALAESPRWTAVHDWTAPGHPWPDGTIIFVRDTPENADAIARARRLAESLGQTPR